MTAVVLQPCASVDARRHYADTIKHPVGINKHATLIEGQVFADLTALFPEGEAAMWGVTPGAKAVNIGKYERAGVGDAVLFSASGAFFAVGTIAYKFRNRDLARQLWDEDPDGQTWELMYALDEIRPFHLTYAAFNAVVGYSPNAVVQGFNVLDAEKSESAFLAFDLYSDKHVAEVSADEFRQAVRAFDGKLDAKVEATRRKEQAYIRKVLFPNPIGRCDICGEDVQRELLVAAHIKKRALCTYEEKLDIPSVVMAACAFGCDDLFERGYIAVGSDQRIIVSTHIPADTKASRVAERLAEREYPAGAGQESYLRWHRENTYRG